MKADQPMYAVVKTGGKQIKVEPGTVAEIELLDAKPGDTITLTPVLVSDEGEVTVDPTKLEAMTVTAEVVEHLKGDKVIVFKFKKRKGYRRLRGHRQDLTRIEVKGIGEAPKKKAAPRKKAAPKAEAATETTAADESAE
jgi:large subunit ribosomal protein L21